MHQKVKTPKILWAALRTGRLYSYGDSWYSFLLDRGWINHRPSGLWRSASNHLLYRDKSSKSKYRVLHIQIFMVRECETYTLFYSSRCCQCVHVFLSNFARFWRIFKVSIFICHKQLSCLSPHWGTYVLYMKKHCRLFMAAVYKFTWVTILRKDLLKETKK